MTSDAGPLRRLDATGLPLLVARLVVGGTFVVLALAKLEDPVTFLKLVRQYGLVPETTPLLLNGIAIAVPWVELLVGALLLLGVAVRGSALLALVMLVVFSGAILSRGLDLAAAGDLAFCAVAFDCGCGTGVVNVCSKLAQNAGLALLAALALLSRSRRLCLRGDLLG